MAYKFYNPNPRKLQTGDCTVRALSKALNIDCKSAYCELCATGLSISDMPSSNNTWGKMLLNKGFRYTAIPNTCPFCYTVSDFCRDNPRGVFILGTGTRVICVKDGDYYSRDGRSMGYSRDDKARMIEQLEDMMQEANTDMEREVLRNCINQMR